MTPTRKYTAFARFHVYEEIPQEIVLPNLRTRRFEPLDRAQPVDRSAGFVQIDDAESTGFGAHGVFAGDLALFAWRVDEVKIDSWVIRQEIQKWAKAFEAENDRPPGRREKMAAKEEIRHTLRQRAPIRSAAYDVVWRVGTGQIDVFASSRKVLDEVQYAIESVLGVKIRPMCPIVVALEQEIPDRVLAPTPALSLPQVKAEPRNPDTDDQAEAEQGKEREIFLRGKAYLGRELLTWLLMRTEHELAISGAENELPVAALFVKKLTLRGLATEVVSETFNGAMAPYSPLVRRAITRGLLVHEARIRFTKGERTYEITVDAETFTLRSVKLPALLSDEEDDAKLELFHLANEIGDILTEIVSGFLQVRAAPGWAGVAEQIRAWAAEGQ